MKQHQSSSSSFRNDDKNKIVMDEVVQDLENLDVSGPSPIPATETRDDAMLHFSQGKSDKTEESHTETIPSISSEAHARCVRVSRKRKSDDSVTTSSSTDNKASTTKEGRAIGDVGNSAESVSSADEAGTPRAFRAPRKGKKEGDEDVPGTSAGTTEGNTEESAIPENSTDEAGTVPATNDGRISVDRAVRAPRKGKKEKQENARSEVVYGAANRRIKQRVDKKQRLSDPERLDSERREESDGEQQLGPGAHALFPFGSDMDLHAAVRPADITLEDDPSSGELGGEYTNFSADCTPGDEEAPTENGSSFLANAFLVGEDDGKDETDKAKTIIASQVVNEATERAQLRKRLCCVGFVVLVTIIGLSVGLANRETQQNGGATANLEISSTPTDNPSESPSASPTSSQCTFCYGGNDDEVDVESLHSLIVKQNPWRSCFDVYSTTRMLTIFDEECTVEQAFAALQCGCDAFPPVPSPNNSTLGCRLCPEGFTVVPADVNDPSEECNRKDSFVQIVGYGESEMECEEMKDIKIRGCGCSPVDANITCIDSLNTIVSLESKVEDTSVPRDYYLCANTDFVTGRFDSESLGFVDGQLPISMRPNSNLYCGYDGRRENNCVVRDGNTGFLLVPMIVYPEFFYDNITVTGVTFRNVTLGTSAMVSLRAPANVTFVDCVFQQNVDGYHRLGYTLYSAVMDPRLISGRRLYHESLSDFDKSDHDDLPSRELQIVDDFVISTIAKSIFYLILGHQDIETSGPFVVHQPGFIPFFPDHRFHQGLAFHDCEFYKIDARSSSIIVQYSQGHIDIRRTCFYNMKSSTTGRDSVVLIVDNDNVTETSLTWEDNSPVDCAVYSRESRECTSFLSPSTPRCTLGFMGE